MFHGRADGRHPAHPVPIAPMPDITALDPAALATARALLGGARRLVVLTGAGVSAESGVPTFRGPGGLWRSHRAEDLATPGAFARDPRLVWEWYGWRRALVAGCAPNAAHQALARHAATHAGAHGAVRLVTQNVDGLHAAAARALGPTVPAAVLPLELHGSLFRVRCTRCDWGAEHREPIDARSLDTLPRCPRCAALARPAVVWFGESLDPLVLEAAWTAAAEAEVCLVVGTSGVVQPAASLAAVTRDAGGWVIEVNPEATPLTGLAAVALRAPAAVAVPALLDAPPAADA